MIYIYVMYMLAFQQLEVYVLKDNSLEFVEKWDNGTFSNGQCYIINNQHLADRHCKRTLYYWTVSPTFIVTMYTNTSLSQKLETEGRQQ